MFLFHMAWEDQTDFCFFSSRCLRQSREGWCVLEQSPALPSCCLVAGKWAGEHTDHPGSRLSICVLVHPDGQEVGLSSCHASSSEEQTSNSTGSHHGGSLVPLPHKKREMVLWLFQIPPLNPGGCNACLQHVSNWCSANQCFPKQKKWTDADNFCSLIPSSIIY